MSDQFKVGFFKAAASSTLECRSQVRGLAAENQGLKKSLQDSEVPETFCEAADLFFFYDQQQY